MSEYITIDIQSEILKRLPLKPLLRFKSVSKPWKRLIDSPGFIAFYGVRHPQPHRFILSYDVSTVDDDEYRYFNSFDDDDYIYVDPEDIAFFQEEFEVDVPYDNLLKLRDGRHPYVVGSSHGLLCFHVRKSDRIPGAFTDMVVLWNPSIRKSVRIELPSMYDSANENYQIGFGVCPVTFDPTIIKIECIDYKSKTEDMSGISRPWRVAVFTLSTGTWSILSTNLPRESIRLRGNQVVIDRFIYWVAFDNLDVLDRRSQSHFLVMSFDLTAKEFKEINLTGSLSNRLCSIQTICKLRESLVLVEYHRERGEDEPVCCLWMMKEQGVSRSFTKLYNINVPHAKVKTLLGFRKTGELILVTEEEPDVAELEFYNPNSKAIVNLQTGGEGYSYFLCSYVESLLLLDKSDDFIYSTK